MDARLSPLPDVGWMLRPLTEIPGVRHAVVVSEDGLHMGHDSASNLTGDVPEIGLAEAEAFSAACSALMATSRSTVGLLLGGRAGIRQVMLDSDQGFVLFTDAGLGACLGVATDTGADMGQVAHEMQVLVAQIGAHLSTQPREPVSRRR